MRALSHLFRNPRLLKGLLALTLCYVLMVQSLGGHHDRFVADASGLHSVCLNGTDSKSNDPVSDPSHDSNVPCCLIFGTGDLPRISPNITALNFAPPIADEPHQEFLYPHKYIFSDRPSQPRAPPPIG